MPGRLRFSAVGGPTISVMAEQCPRCLHTRCGEGCECNCDAAHAESYAARLEAQIEAAETALGRAWLHGGATLAEGIARKTAAMERLAMPRQRKMPGATLTVEREDGTGETTTYGCDR